MKVCSSFEAKFTEMHFFWSLENQKVLVLMFGVLKILALTSGILSLNDHPRIINGLEISEHLNEFFVPVARAGSLWSSNSENINTSLYDINIRSVDIFHSIDQHQLVAKIFCSIKNLSLIFKILTYYGRFTISLSESL